MSGGPHRSVYDVTTSDWNGWPPFFPPEVDQFWVSSIEATVATSGVWVPPPFQHAPDDPVLICHTSGTTGPSKPVIWTHAQMMVGIRAHLTQFRDHPRSMILSALPQSHGAAIGYALLAMLSGVRLTLMSDRSGSAVISAAGRYGATIVVGFAATLAELALAEIDSADLDLVERWVSVGDAAHRAHIARLIERGRHWAGADSVPGSMFVDGFGSSELGWGGVLGSITIPGVVAPHRCIGVAQEFADVAVLRPDGSHADTGEVGLLGVRPDGHAGLLERLGHDLSQPAERVLALGRPGLPRRGGPVLSPRSCRRRDPYR